MAKTARERTAEELYHLSREAIENPELIKIVLNASVKENGHTNLTSVYKNAYDYALKNSDGDLQIAKRWAVSTRWAAKFKDEYPLDFKTEVAEADISRTLKRAEKAAPAPEPKPEPKDVEIQLLGEIIITHPDFGYNRLRIKKENMPHNAIVMTQHLLESITGVVYKFDDKERLIFHPVGLRNYIIQILEEKCGIDIKICGLCKSRSSGGLCTDKSPKSRTKFSYSSLPCREHFDSCSNFEPKEISEETPRLRSGQEK